jgi:hypothetical protein
MANYPQKGFWGTAQTVINSSTDVAALNFSGAPAATYDNTTDAAVPYAEYAVATAVFPDWGGTPVAGTLMELWGLLKDVDGTDDDTNAPSATESWGARYFGSFIVGGVDALQRRTITISMLGVQKVDFYIKNGTAQNLNNDGGTNMLVKVTPLALGMTV